MPSALSLLFLSLLALSLSYVECATKVTTKCNLKWKYPVPLGKTTIYEGTKCTWTWSDDLTHCIQGLKGPQGFKSLNIPGNGFTYSYTFKKAGTYPYNCCVHQAQMKGTIVVIKKKGAPTSPSTCKTKCNGKCWGSNGCGGTCPYPKKPKDTLVACRKCCKLGRTAKTAIVTCIRNCVK